MMIFFIFLEPFPAVRYIFTCLKEASKGCHFHQGYSRKEFRIMSFFNPVSTPSPSDRTEVRTYLIKAIDRGYLKPSPFAVFTVAYIIKKNSMTLIETKIKIDTTATATIPLIFSKEN